MLKGTTSRTPLGLTLYSNRTSVRPALFSSVMLNGQSIVLTQAHTTLSPVVDSGPRMGMTAWSANVMGHKVWLSWDGVEEMPFGLILADPLITAIIADAFVRAAALGRDAISFEMCSRGQRARAGHRPIRPADDGAAFGRIAGGVRAPPLARVLGFTVGAGRQWPPRRRVHRAADAAAPPADAPRRFRGQRRPDGAVEVALERRRRYRGRLPKGFGNATNQPSIRFFAGRDARRVAGTVHRLSGALADRQSFSHKQETAMTKVRKVRFPIALGCVFLAACSGAPSEGDIRGALDRQIKTEQESLAKLGGAFGGTALVKSMIPAISGVKKVGCKEDGEKAYRCDVEVEVSRGDKTSKGPAVLRLVKLSDGWSITR